MRIIISDTSCLIDLRKADLLAATLALAPDDWERLTDQGLDASNEPCEASSDPPPGPIGRHVARGEECALGLGAIRAEQAIPSGQIEAEVAVGLAGLWHRRRRSNPARLGGYERNQPGEGDKSPAFSLAHRRCRSG